MGFHLSDPVFQVGKFIFQCTHESYIVKPLPLITAHRIVHRRFFTLFLQLPLGLHCGRSFIVIFKAIRYLAIIRLVVQQKISCKIDQ